MMNLWMPGISKGVKIATSIGIKYAPKLFRAEGRILNKVYGRYPGQTAARGVRHGLLGGQAYSFISQQQNTFNDGEVQKVNENASSKPHKARYRRAARHCNCHSGRNRFNSRKRQSKFSSY